MLVPRLWGGGERLVVSRLVRGGKVKLTGGGDFKRVYGGEDGGSDEILGLLV